jgi:hypothetical protein
MLKYDLNLDENKFNNLLKIIAYLKKVFRQFNTLIHKAHRSLRFRSIGIDIVRESDPMFLENSVCSICGQIHTPPGVVNDLLISALDFVI